MTSRTLTRVRRGLLATGATILAAGCTDPTATGLSSDLASAALTASLSTVPVGYGDLSSSYVGTASASVSGDGMWLGGGRDARFDGGGLMGGGLGDAFAGGLGAGRGRGDEGPFGGGLGCDGVFSASTGRVACSSVTRNGLTVTRSAAYATAAGAVQQAFDSLTNTVNVRSQVAGSFTYSRSADSTARANDAGGRGGREHGWGEGRGPGGRLLGDTATIIAATTTVNASSDRTVTGLAAGSTQRTVNGTSSGNESTVGTSSRGQFTATRQVADTTRGLVVPVQAGRQTYPTAGTVIRLMQASLMYAGQSAVTVSRREVVTYDGSATAQVTITENGTTKSCTRPLPRGRLACQ